MSPPSADRRSGPHLSPEQLALYAGQKLPPAELLAVDDHLTSCALCQEALAEHWDAAPAFAAWRDLVAGAAAGESASGPAEPSRWGGVGRWAWPLAAGLLLVAGAALFVREAAVSRQRARQVAELEARLRATQPELERLRAANRELERRVEHLAAVSTVSPSPDTPPPAVQVRLADQGYPLELRADGSLSGLAELAPVWRTAVAQALSTGALAVSPSLREVRTTGSALRGAGSNAPPFAVLGPVGTAVRDDHPTFRWTALSGATGYRVVLFDRAYRKVQESGETPGTEWTPAQPLPRGQVLVWQVVAWREGEEIAAPAPPAPEARLRVLSAAERAALAPAEKQVAGSHLARAVLLARSGLLEEARSELAALARENPGSPIVARLNAGLAGDRQ